MHSKEIAEQQEKVYQRVMLRFSVAIVIADVLIFVEKWEYFADINVNTITGAKLFLKKNGEGSGYVT